MRFLLFALIFLLGIYSCNPDQGRESIIHKDSFELKGLNTRGSSFGMDAETLDRIPLKMQQFVEDVKMAGSVTLVARKGQIASFDAVGFQDLENAVPMQTNSIFRIASMTKPFVAAAIMMLAEQGKLSLDDPAQKFLPGFADMWSTGTRNDDEMLLQRPLRPITIRDLLTHTSGLARVPRDFGVSSIREHTLIASRYPLEFEPGSRWQYSGEGITAAARIVEVLSGMDYTGFLKEKIFIPLGMNDTYFFYPEEQSERVVTNYRPGEKGGLEASKGLNQGKYFRPEGGLLSTAVDMVIWMQTILDGGIYNNTRILSEESVEQMTRTQSGELETGFTGGMSFGLAFGVVNKPTGVTLMLSPGTFGHGGAYGTQYWADPVTGTIYILMIQRQGFGNGDDSDIRKTFQEIAASAIID